MKNISKQAFQAYNTLLKYSRLTVNQEIFFRNVDLSQDSHIHEIYTKPHSKKTLPHLVLLHGFAGSAMSYIRTFHSLSQHYTVHALDHYGNGFSSRKQYDINRTQNQILHLYVDSIQQWRKSLGIQTMVLAGHSFGGYLAALYMLKHQKVVDRLVLLSPVGTSSQGQIHREIQSRKAESLKNRITIGLIQKVFNLKVQPSKIFSIPMIGEYLVNKFLKSTIKLEKQEKQMWKRYIMYISQQQSHIEKSFYQCFEWPFVSKMISISEILQKIVQTQREKSIQFYYGQHDWTENIAAKKLQTKYQNIYCETIPKATHNMIFDFPHEVTERLISQPSKEKVALAKV